MNTAKLKAASVTAIVVTGYNVHIGCRKYWFCYESHFYLASELTDSFFTGSAIISFRSTFYKIDI